jgi:hypothetical protein
MNDELGTKEGWDNHHKDREQSYVQTIDQQIINSIYNDISAK